MVLIFTAVDFGSTKISACLLFYECADSLAISPRLLSFYCSLCPNLSTSQGYLSFWNDNISYALRGCILIELALRRRIALVKDPNRRRNPLPERLIEVIDDRQTGETILDETLKMMKAQEGEKLGINSWIDLLSGEYSVQVNGSRYLASRNFLTNTTDRMFGWNTVTRRGPLYPQIIIFGHWF